MDSDSDIRAVSDTDGLLLFRAFHGSDRNRISENSLIVTAQLTGLFFQPSKESAGRDTLVCYRRNLFGIRGTIIIPGGTDDLSRQLGISSRILSLVATISATESIHQNLTTIISVPKGTAESIIPGPVTVEVRGPERGSEPIAFAWSRLQFRNATAKSGRRKDKSGEQFFVTKITICLHCEDKSEVLLTELHSAPIVVRGRSPRNFSAMKIAAEGLTEVQRPVSGLTPGENIIDSTCLSSVSSDQPLSRAKDVHNADAITPQGQESLFHFSTPGMDALAVGDISADFADGAVDSGNDVPNYLVGFDAEYEGMWDFNLAEDFSHGIQDLEQSSTVPVVQGMLHSRTASTPQPQASTKKTIKLAESLIQTRSFSYEYVPLTLDDRTPPVQAVYQPHAVHHKIVLPKTSQGNSKRYFGEFSDTEGD